MSAEPTVDLDQLPGAQDDPSAWPTLYSMVLGGLCVALSILFVQYLVYDFRDAEKGRKTEATRELQERKDQQLQQLRGLPRAMDRVIAESRR